MSILLRGDPRMSEVGRYFYNNTRAADRCKALSVFSRTAILSTALVPLRR